MVSRTLVATVGVAVVVVLCGGCASSATSSNGGATGTPTAATSTATTSPANSKTVTINLVGNHVEPALGRLSIAKGTTLVLVVNSDHDDTVHVHGYDVEAQVPANGSATIEIHADMTGSFEVESHTTNKLLFNLVVS